MAAHREHQLDYHKRRGVLYVRAGFPHRANGLKECQRRTPIRQREVIRKRFIAVTAVRGNDVVPAIHYVESHTDEMVVELRVNAGGLANPFEFQSVAGDCLSDAHPEEHPSNPGSTCG